MVAILFGIKFFRKYLEVSKCHIRVRIFCDMDEVELTDFAENFETQNYKK
jgi:hypothetical protein